MASSPTNASSNANNPIGVFDSGIGGLTVVARLRRALPHEDIVYLGDTARVPYGTKAPNTIIRFAHEDAAFLIHQHVKAVVVACNSASAYAVPSLEKTLSIPVFGVIIPGAAAALARTQSGRIGVIGTRATIRSRAYEHAVLERNPSAKVFARACPLLVPLVEEGWLRHPVTRAVLRAYLAPLLRRNIDTLILGCTHYPLLKPLLKKLLPKRVALIDSAESCALFVRDALDQKNLLSQRRTRPGRIHPFVTDEAQRFQTFARSFLRAPTLPARRVELATIPAH